MQYAVIETGGKQYKINTGDTLEVEKLPVNKGDSISFDKVLLVVDGGKVNLGTPYVTGVTIDAKVIDHVKGEKIYVSKFRAKSKYRRVTGHRQHLSRIEIAGIKSKKAEKV